MSSSPAAELRETHILGRQTRQWIVRAEDCSALQAFHIKHVSLLDAATPFRIVRLNPDGSFLLFCLGGQGRILLDGRWRVCGAGTAALVPPHVLDAFQAAEQSRWQICWVRYREPRGQIPVVMANSPVLVRHDPEPIRTAIWGLYCEMRNASDPAAVRHWVELIHRYALRVAQPHHMDNRLWPLWQRVSESLGEHWTLSALARLACMSGEHLRRICRKHLGRSPMQQVTFLRIQRAAERLERTTEKVETIAHEVGYRNPFTFSNTFKKWTGYRPSEYRLRRHPTHSPLQP